MKIKLNVMFTISAMVMFFIGLGLTIMTTTMLGMIGLDANPASIHFAKAGGIALIGVAVMTWIARNAGPSQARNALTLGLTLLFLLEGIEYLRGIFTGSLGLIGWISVGMWLLLFVFMALAGSPPWPKKVNPLVSLLIFTLYHGTQIDPEVIYD